MNNLNRKKSGYPLQEKFLEPLYLQQYSKIIEKLNNDINITISEQELANINFKLQTFIEENFGKNSIIPRKFVKLPHNILNDFSIDGSLLIIFKILLKRITPLEWKNFNIQDNLNKEILIEIMSEIETILKKNKLLVRPTIYFSQHLSESLKRELSQIVRNHDGKVTNILSEATHVVDWDDEVDGTLPQHLVEEFIRPLEIHPHKGDGTALVHWWYHPDSYDEWIPSQEVEANDPPEDPLELRPRIWKVCCRFIRDVAIFNEWGNELDYEMDENEDENFGLGGGNSNNNNNNNSSNGDGSSRKNRKGRKSDENRNKKKVETLISEAIGATEKMLQYLPPPTDDPTNPTYTVVTITGQSQCEIKTQTNNSNNTNNNLTKKRSISSEQEEENGKNYENPLEKIKKRLCLDGNQSNIDGDNLTYPPWFDHNNISSVEIRYIPEILNCDLFYHNSHSNSNTNGNINGNDSTNTHNNINQTIAQKYITCRNYIMDLYTQNPYLYLSATECRQKIAGDVSFIIRIHEFLDVFGLINFSPKIKPHSRPPKSSSFYSTFPTQNEIKQHCNTIESINKQILQNNDNSNNDNEKSKIRWTEELDNLLLTTLLEQANVVNDSTVDIDWNSISIPLSKINSNITSKECYSRFVQMSLLNSNLLSTSQNVTQLDTTSNYHPINSTSSSLPPSSSSSTIGVFNSASSHTHTAGSGKNSWGVSRKIRSVASLIISEFANKINYQQAKEIITSINQSYQKINESNNTLLISSLVGGAEIISNAAEAALKSKEQTVDSLLQDYIATRLVALEEKMKLITAIEKTLDIERERIELDRRDIQIQRAQSAFYPPR